MLERSPSYINITLTAIERGNSKWGFTVVRQLTFVQNTFSDIMPDANVEHGHESTSLYEEEERVKATKMDSCSDSQSTIVVNGYPATKEKDELVVSIVRHGSPAHDAGLAVGDIVDSVYGQKDPTLSLLFGIMRDSTSFVVKVKRMESCSFERGFREKHTEHVPVALVEERISGDSVWRCDDGPGRLEMHNNPEDDIVRPLDGDNDENVLSAFTDDDLLDNNIALAMAMAPQYLTDANGKSRTGVDINQAVRKTVHDADNSDDGQIRQVASFDRVHAQVEKNGIGQQKTHASGSDGVCMVEESPYLDATDVQEDIISKEHGLLHYGLHAVDEEKGSFDQSDVEPATDYQSQADCACGSSTSDSDDQMREEPFRDSPFVQTMDKSSNKDSSSERRKVDDVREEQSLFTAKKSFTSESEKGDSVGVPPRQKKSKPKAKKRKVSEDSTLSKQEKISKNKRKKERCRGEDEMANKDAKQNEKKKRKKEITASCYHLVVPAGTDVINTNGNGNDNGNAHEEVVDEHTVAAVEVVEEQSITDKNGNVTSLERRPVLQSPPPVNSKTKCNQAYESNFHEIWNILFMELVEYKEENGHCNIPTRNGSLGGWVKKQRAYFRSKKLKADRHEKLVGIGFIFEDARFATDQEKWNTSFMKLVEYKEENGHCNIPTTKNGSLGGWIYTQRAFFKSKKLKTDRHEKLVGIGFIFEDVTALEHTEKLDQQWQDMYQKLLEHKETKGHCFDLPQTLPLGRWLNYQRWLYRNGKLREDRVEKLLSVGFDDKKGLKKGEAVSARDASSGQPPRKMRKVLDLDNDLAAITHDEGEKGIDDINAEDDINDNGNAHEEIVEKHAVAATELVEEGSITDKNGNVTSFAEMPALHSPPPVNSKTKCNQAYEPKHHEIWNRHFMELVEYKKKNGHCNIPRRNGILGGWIARQRTLFQSKKLIADRHEKLVGIGFIFEDASLASENVKWNRRFMELEKYKEMNGHCNIPTTNGSLGGWISYQRSLFKSKKLKADRHEKLVEIGFAFLRI
jgi:hypothetical protein